MEWVHCLSCDREAVHCKHCNNASCTGGGCDVCKADFILARKMIEDGTAPSKKDLPKIGGGFDLMLEYGKECQEQNKEFDDAEYERRYDAMVANWKEECD
jgi:hypothetical protein